MPEKSVKKSSEMHKKKELQIIKMSCKNYYDKSFLEYHDKYMDELRKKPFDKQFLDKFNSLLKGHQKILDIGCCSAAQQARYMYEKGHDITSIDVSEKSIKFAQDHFTGIEFKQMDMLNLDFKPECFDGIMAFYSIIHIPDEELDSLFSGFNLILKRGGLIAITVHMGDFYGFYNERDVPVFYRTYTQDDLSHYMQKYGFSFVQIQTRKPIYDSEFQSNRLYVIAQKK